MSILRSLCAGLCAAGMALAAVQVHAQAQAPNDPRNSEPGTPSTTKPPGSGGKSTDATSNMSTKGDMKKKDMTGPDTGTKPTDTMNTQKGGARDGAKPPTSDKKP